MKLEKFMLHSSLANLEYENIRLNNTTGMEVVLSSVGAGIKSIKVPTLDGSQKEMTFVPAGDDEFPFVYHGKTIGRTSGRIKGATFTLGNKTAILDKNNFGQDNLHGGKRSFNSFLFSLDTKETKDYTDVIFKYHSPDGENGFFGTIDVTITYRVFENENSVRIFFDGQADQLVLMNLTNHAFFNLAGDPTSPIDDQILYINASKYTRLGKTLLCESIDEVTKEFDFRTPHRIGEYNRSTPLQTVTKGYDHPFFLDESGMDKLAASLYSKESGVKLEVRTTYPCCVIFSPTNPFTDIKREGIDYSKVRTCCIECQFFPDAVHMFKERNGVFDENHPYHEETEFKFILEK